MSGKVNSHHLRCKVVLGMRQLSLRKVMHNQEIRMPPYGMRNRLHGFGWSQAKPR